MHRDIQRGDNAYDNNWTRSLNIHTRQQQEHTLNIISTT